MLQQYDEDECRRVGYNLKSQQHFLCDEIVSACAYNFHRTLFNQQMTPFYIITLFCLVYRVDLDYYIRKQKHGLGVGILKIRTYRALKVQIPYPKMLPVSICFQILSNHLHPVGLSPGWEHYIKAFLKNWIRPKTFSSINNLGLATRCYAIVGRPPRNMYKINYYIIKLLRTDDGSTTWDNSIMPLLLSPEIQMSWLSSSSSTGLWAFDALVSWITTLSRAPTFTPNNSDRDGH